MGLVTLLENFRNSHKRSWWSHLFMNSQASRDHHIKKSLCALWNWGKSRKLVRFRKIFFWDILKLVWELDKCLYVIGYVPLRSEWLMSNRNWWLDNEGSHLSIVKKVYFDEIIVLSNILFRLQCYSQYFDSDWLDWLKFYASFRLSPFKEDR